MDTTTANKRRKLSHHRQPEAPAPPPLIPGLPDHVAHTCLSHVHPSTLYSVSHSWRRLIYSPCFPPFLSLYTLFSSNDAVFHFFNFDPISSTWHSLPSPPPDPPLNQLIVRHPSFISRSLPVQSISICGQLILLAATASNLSPALSHPLIFNPLSKDWAFGPPFAAPRRWCAAGALGTSVYIASGIGSHFSIDVARSVEKWDLKNTTTTTARRIDGGGSTSGLVEKLEIESKKTTTTAARRIHGGGGGGVGWRWEKVKGLKDGRFSREAIDAVGWRGKLCMVNVKGAAAKEGVVYDVKEDTWQKMSDGMVAGWRGPAAAMDEEILYVVDESRGALRKYDHETDTRLEILESENLIGAQRIAAAGGRVCVVCGGGRGGIVVVDVKSENPRLWVVETPPGLEAVAVHVLPRMSVT